MPSRLLGRRLAALAAGAAGAAPRGAKACGSNTPGAAACCPTGTGAGWGAAWRGGGTSRALGGSAAKPLEGWGGGAAGGAPPKLPGALPGLRISASYRGLPGVSQHSKVQRQLTPSLPNRKTYARQRAGRGRTLNAVGIAQRVEGVLAAAAVGADICNHHRPRILA